MYAQLLAYALLTSLKIVFIWGAMQEGMILFVVRRVIDWMIEPLPATLYLWLRKPLYSCLFCMSSVWGFLFTVNVSAFDWWYFQFLFTVAGINYVIQSLIRQDGEE